MSYGAISRKDNIRYDQVQQSLHFEDGARLSFNTSLLYKSRILFVIFTASLLVGLAFFLAATGIDFHGTNHTTVNFDEHLVEISIQRVGYQPILSVSKFNNHENTITYDALKNYYGVIEPHSPMNLEVRNPVLGLSYFFSLQTTSTENLISSGYISTLSSTQSLQSDSIRIACSSYDEFLLKISVLTTSLETATEFSFPLICMYVRREIRSLLPEDLNNTLDAMLAIYTEDEDEGRAKYGVNFHASTYFNEWHYFNAAQRDSDHIHEGVGFLIQHAKATNQFELAMQAVNPSVSLPYWDFTIEGEANMTIFESPIFTPEMFGSCPKPKDTSIGFSYSKDSLLDAAIPNGRWAYLEAGLNTKYPTMKQPFGYLRAPWNLNPSPYISRYTYTGDTEYFPSCTEYYDLLNLTDFTSFQNYIPYGPHGPTHILAGGFMGCELLSPIFELGYLRYGTVLLLCSKWGFVIKQVYRFYGLDLPSECTVTSYDFIGIEGCQFTCDSVEVTGALAAQVLISYGFSFNDPFEGNISIATYLGEFLCGGNASKIYVGDHLESASPADPSFWVIHPTLDRVQQAKYLVGGFETEDWPTMESDVCDTYDCYEDDSGNKVNSTECCYGHHFTDQVLDYISGNTSQYIGATNEDTLKAMDPRYSTYAMPYIYDTFTWNHCDEDDTGVNINELLMELKQKYFD